ncbi:MAG: hypothetical protein H0U06_12290 [Solirubrobacterales bacterium]|nr:hypothetical protein [Solirubrobacterales bacterium]
MAVIANGCGADDSSSDSGTKSSATPAVEPTATAEASAGLVGEWSTQNVCANQVRAFKKAGLDEFVREWVAGNYPGVSSEKVDASSDPCRGAKPVKHSHSLGEDGAFASYDQAGMPVDDGTYKEVDDGTFTLSEPPIRLRYKIDGDKATFKVAVPDCKAKRCRESAAYVVSAFFPRTYERVK